MWRIIATTLSLCTSYEFVIFLFFPSYIMLSGETAQWIFVVYSPKEKVHVLDDIESVHGLYVVREE